MAMSKGLEMMMKSVIGMLGLNPVVIEEHIVGIAKSLHTIAVNSETVRRQNSAMMAHLGVPEPLTQEQEHARDEREITGRSAGTA